MADLAAAHAATARAFDAVAPGYDTAYGPAGNTVMAWLRAESLALLEATFPSGAHLLEIGCGTGDEALHLARRGNTIVATDVSPRMTAMTAQKVQAAGLSDRVITLALPAAHIGQIEGSASFDGAYASFGALNCEPDLPALAAGLARLLRPGTHFVCSVMARLSPFEIAWFLAHARPRLAFRRLRRGWLTGSVTGVGGGHEDVEMRYLGLGDLREAFATTWIVERSLSLSLLLPPPYLDNLYRAYPRLWERVSILERRLRGRWPWRAMGDHIAAVMRRAK